MKIGIDARLLSEKITGINRFLWNVVKYLPLFDTNNKYVLFTYEGTKYRNNFYSYNYLVKSKLPRQFCEHYWLNFILPKLLIDQSINLFFTPYILVPLKRGPYKNVIVIHDVMTKASKQFFTSYYKKYMDFIVPAAIKRSDAIVTVSESAREDIIKYYNVSQEKVHLMHLWTDEKYSPLKLDDEQVNQINKKYELPEIFILYVGAIEERKNILGILKISDILKSRGVNVKIVLVGSRGFGFKRLNDEIIKRKDSVLYLDYVQEQDLPLIYNLAKVFLFPSYYEGFGLTPLEAMKCGLPVLASKNSSLIEVVGDGGLLFDPEDHNSFVDQIVLLLNNKEFHASMKTKALAHSEKYKPKNEITKLIKLFNSLH